jgi:hypothetical protein
MGEQEPPTLFSEFLRCLIVCPQDRPPLINKCPALVYSMPDSIEFPSRAFTWTYGTKGSSKLAVTMPDRCWWIFFNFYNRPRDLPFSVGTPGVGYNRKGRETVSQCSRIFFLKKIHQHLSGIVTANFELPFVLSLPFRLYPTPGVPTLKGRSRGLL